MTYVEAKFCLRIRDSKPSDTGARGHSDPMDVDAVSRLAKERDHRVRAMGVLSAVVHIFNETAMDAKAQGSNRMVKANIASHGSRVRAKARVKKTRVNPKEPKVPEAHTKAKYRKLVSQVLKLEIGGELGHTGICTEISH